MLKKFLTAIVFPCLGLSGLFAQQLKQTKPVEAVVFTKTIEQNFIGRTTKQKKSIISPASNTSKNYFSATSTPSGIPNDPAFRRSLWFTHRENRAECFV